MSLCLSRLSRNSQTELFSEIVAMKLMMGLASQGKSMSLGKSKSSIHTTSSSPIIPVMLLLRISIHTIINKAMSRSNDMLMLEDKVSHLLGLLESHRWTCFRSTALPNPLYFKALTNLIGKMPQLNGMTLLRVTYDLAPRESLLLRRHGE